MKNQLFVGLMSSFLFLSCSSSNDENNEPNPSDPQILLSKVTTVSYTSPSGPQTSIAKFDYNSQKQLLKITSENTTSVLEYDSAGKPSKITYQKPDGTVAYYKTFTYNGDQLTTVKTIYSDTHYNTAMTYTNGKVTATSTCESSNCPIPSTMSYTYSGENVSEEISVNDGIGGPHINKREFSYDNKINPYSLLGKYFRAITGEAQFLSQNNYTTLKISGKDDAGNWNQILNFNYQIEYNNNQLPTQVMVKVDNNDYAKYTYEYITQ
ncbi:hypothetical protein J2799_003791 [Chryseobacterium vietnamense]|uniref:hypothetical protein n=1 Tax=Chryseobacterium vietnamense TaxID=866785 RepID=UPI0028659A9D|nr:hypothetical protein [Chryseobacterium vietnamense]MDR6489252.1 hypothetical protein [Chryseobacterium vietnamense]